MSLTLILGPMKSGKSAEIIDYHNNCKLLPIGTFQPVINVRDAQIISRNGQSIQAIKIASLIKIIGTPYKTIIIDELHMFPIEEAVVIKTLLTCKREIVIASLDFDYRGVQFPIIDRLMTFKDTRRIIHKFATCELCHSPQANRTIIFKHNIPIFSGIPSVIPEDGSYIYKPVCLDCFLKLKNIDR